MSKRARWICKDASNCGREVGCCSGHVDSCEARAMLADLMAVTESSSSRSPGDSADIADHDGRINRVGGRELAYCEAEVVADYEALVWPDIWHGSHQ